ncbi:MAG: universal stress protein [Bacteroidota bacterium]
MNNLKASTYPGTSVNPSEGRVLLFPTDFSETAHRAFEYTLQLAEVLDARIELLHVYFETPILADKIPAGFIEALREEKVEKAQSFFEAYQAEAKQAIGKNVVVNTHIAGGYAVDEIVRLASEINPTMIVMGTHGTASATSKVFGSVTASVIEKCSVPVLAVPKEAEYRPWKHLMYATSFEERDFEIIDRLLDLASATDARLYCTHVRTSDAYWSKIELGVFQNLYQMETDNRQLEFYLIQDTDVISGLQHFVNQHEIDVMSMLTHRRDLIEGLYGDSITREMALQTDSPLLVFQA